MVPVRIVNKLRRLGYDVVTVQQLQGTSEPEIGLLDEFVLDTARTLRRAVLTMNEKHFCRLHYAKPGHHGVIICTQTPDWTKRAKEIDDAIKGEAPLLGKLIYVPAKGVDPP